jgi:uncharacterized protein (TIGR02246 family)
MKTMSFAAAIFAVTTAGCSADNGAVAKAKAETEAAKAAQAKAEAELERIKGGAPDRALLNKQRTALVDAFNRGDAEAWAKAYAEDAEVIYETGDVYKGPAEIQKFYAKLFGDNPGMKLTAADMTSERFLTPGIVLEDGWWQVAPRNDGGARAGRYTNVWMYHNGQWLVTSGRAWVPIKLPLRRVPPSVTAAIEEQYQSVAPDCGGITVFQSQRSPSRGTNGGDAPGNRELDRFVDEHAIHWMSLTPDGRHVLISPSRAMVLKLLRLPSIAWPANDIQRIEGDGRPRER